MPRTKKHAKRSNKPARKGRSKGYSHNQVARAVNKTTIGNIAQETPTKYAVAGITGCPRIATMGSLFQDYRVTEVKIKFMPNLNTFGAGTTTGYIPQLLTKVLDVQPPVGMNEAAIVQMDPKTHELTQKDFTVSFKPKVNMLASTTGAAGQGVMIKKSPWLSTNGNANTGGAWVPDSTEHFGLIAYITNSVGNDTIGCGYQAEVFYEFRRPFAQPSSSSIADSKPTDAKLL